MSLFLGVFFSFWLLWSSISYAQTELNKQACVFELSELSPGTPESLVSFNLPDHLKIPLIDLTRLRIKLAQGSDQAYLHHHYLNELKKLKEAFIAQNYTEEFFNDTRTFFFRELSQRDETLERGIETKTSLTQKQKDDLLHPLRGRTRQVIDAIVAMLQIPENDVTIEDLERITKLDLDGKNITELRAGDFKGLINLKELFLNHNQLSELPETVFQGLGALVWLYLNDNKLTGLPQTVFWDLKALELLYLNNNQLKGLPQNVFRGLGALRWLYLSYNKLTGLPQNLFQGLGALERLYLHNNQLTGLPQNVFQGLGALERLFLSSNPISVISESVFSAPGLNQNFEIILNRLILDENTKQMLRKKFKNQIIEDWSK